MLTAHNGQLASFVCVMSYVFKFSIAYIHVYNRVGETGLFPVSTSHTTVRTVRYTAVH